MLIWTASSYSTVVIMKFDNKVAMAQKFGCMHSVV